ncbi:MAG: hypothetical protein AB7I30_08965 [Isosphaeraceae bacterium]
MGCASKISVTAAGIVLATLAQGSSVQAQYFPTTQPIYRPSPPVYPQTQPYYPQPQPFYPQTQPVYPQYPTYPPGQPTYPQYPVLQTQPQVSGFTPTGGVNTQGTTLFNSAFDPYRQSSMNNGTLQNVSQPILGPNGQIVGYQTGQQWQNSVTGQTHFQGQVVTPNGLGGFENQTVIRSGNPMAGGAARPAAPRSGFTLGVPGR